MAARTSLNSASRPASSSTRRTTAGHAGVQVPSGGGGDHARDREGLRLVVADADQPAEALHLARRRFARLVAIFGIGAAGDDAGQRHLVESRRPLGSPSAWRRV